MWVKNIENNLTMFLGKSYTDRFLIYGSSQFQPIVVKENSDYSECFKVF